MKDLFQQLPLFRLAALTAAALLAGCASKEPVDELSGDPLAKPVDEQELAYIPTYSKAVLAGWPRGRALDPYDKGRVRLDEEVHAYHLGRLPSRDRREMHEAHTVYRVEQDARWDTRLPATPMESRGVTLGIVDPARSEVPQDVIISQERQAMAAKMVVLRQQMTALEQKSVQLDAQRRKFEEAEENTKAITEQLGRIIGEKNQKEEEITLLKARIQKMEDDERLRAMTADQGIGQRKKK